MVFFYIIKFNFQRIVHVVYAIANDQVAAIGPSSDASSDSDTRLTFSCFQVKVVDVGVKGVKRHRQALCDGEIASVMLSQALLEVGGGGGCQNQTTPVPHGAVTFVSCFDIEVLIIYRVHLFVTYIIDC